LAAKTRYRQTDAPCQVTAIGADHLALAFDPAQWAVTPGQSAVLYDGDVCLGGGVIHQASALERALPSAAPTPRPSRRSRPPQRA
jgi:tRNA-specific 2-thiouridylase